MMKKVAVIGAGPAGLATLQVLSSQAEALDVVCFEKSDRVGGEWNYSEDASFVDGARPNAMYDNLRTNSNAPLNSLPGWEIQQEPHWHGHKHILQYLNDYTRECRLTHMIRLETEVSKVSRVQRETPGDVDQWRIETKTKDGACHVSMFDAVVVCSGHYQDAVFPTIKGQELFEGDIIHSCQYRNPEKYSGKTVLMIGTGVSGKDITHELRRYAKKVIFNTVPKSILEDNVEVAGTKFISHFTKNSVVFENDLELAVDHVIFSTGYKPNYPFLDDTCGIQIMDGLVYPLYKLVVHPDHHTLFFNGQTRFDPHFILVTITAKCIRNIMLGDVTLPSSHEMRLDIDREIQRFEAAGVKIKQIHHLVHSLDKNFKIAKEISDLAGEPYPEKELKIFRGILGFLFQGKINYAREFKLSLDKEETLVVEKLEA